MVQLTRAKMAAHRRISTQQNRAYNLASDETQMKSFKRYMKRHGTFLDNVLYLLAQKNVRPIHIAASTLKLEFIFCIIQLVHGLRHDPGTLYNNLVVGSDRYGHWHLRKGMERANLHNVTVPTADDEVAILPEV